MRYVLAAAAVALLTIVGARLGTEAQPFGPIIQLVIPNSKPVAPLPSIANVTLNGGSTGSYTSGAPSQTPIGPIVVTMTSGTFDGALVTSNGTPGNYFTISGSTLQTNNTTPTCTSLASYNFNIIATPGAGESGSPFTLPVTVTCNPVVVGNCGATPMGSAAADVTAAGFGTCALYSDFTTPIPNTVGTGLPCPSGSSGTICLGGTTPVGNWMDCNFDNATTSLYYWVSSLGCSVLSQGNDGSNGRALHITATPSQLNQNGSWIFNFNTSYTYNDGFYIELKFRDNYTQANPSFTGSGVGMDFWSQGSSTGNLPCTGYVNYGTIYQAFINQALEIDFFEGGVSSGQSSNPPLFAGYGNTHPNAGNVDTNGNPLPNCPQTNGGVGYLNMNGGNSGLGFDTPAVDFSQVTTYGEIVTNDASSNFQACNYTNGTLNSCTSYNFNNNDFNQERRQIIFVWSNASCQGQSCNQEDFWIYYLKIWTCASWQNSNAAVAACPGTGNNGRIFTGAS